VGASCSFSGECASGRCLQASGGGTCADPLSPGEACENNLDCASPAYCDKGTGVCQAPRKNGESCSAFSSRPQCASGRCAYGQCEEALTCAESAYPSDAARQFEQDFLDATCAQAADCCTAAGLPSTPTFCRFLEGSLRAQPFASLSFDATAAAACLAAKKSAGCGGLLGTEVAPDKQDPCERVYTTGKNAPPGGACDSDEDCATPESGRATCVSGATGATCVVHRPGKLGDSCTGLGDTRVVCRSQDSLVCDSGSGACAPLGGDGAPCVIDQGCLSTHVCDVSSGKCVAKPKLGEACTSPTSCFDGYCANGTCITLAAQGSACTFQEQCASGKCASSLCVEDIGFAALFCR
jgi:hypothetical protein